MHLSIVIPLLNEAESLPELESWIGRIMQENQFDYEIIFIDDGSTDTSWAVIETLAQNNKNVKAIKFRRNYGKSAALNEGFKLATAINLYKSGISSGLSCKSASIVIITCPVANLKPSFSAADLPDRKSVV